MDKFRNALKFMHSAEKLKNNNSKNPIDEHSDSSINIIFHNSNTIYEKYVTNKLTFQCFTANENDQIAQECKKRLIHNNAPQEEVEKKMG